MDFVHLHLHSTYSFLDGFGTIKQIVKRAKEIGFKSLALTDHRCVDGLIPFYYECKKQNIKPILGVEFDVYTHNNLKVRKAYHITVLSKNEEGFKNLCKLTTMANKQFYYTPRVSLRQVMQHQEGLIILSGCYASPFFDIGFIAELQSYFKDFYVEIVTIGFPEYIDKIKKYIDIIRKNGFKLVATGDVHFMNKGEEDIQEIMRIIRYKQLYKDKQTHLLPDLYLKNREEMEQTLKKYFPFLEQKEITEMLDNTIEIAKKCNAKIVSGMSLEFDTGDLSKEDYLMTLLYTGMADRKIPKNDIYRNRLIDEIKIIRDKDFLDYFLIVADIVKWAKKNNILVGPSRGSSGASLLCYLLGITEIDPIKYNLLFERFLSPDREDPPDIDIDFEDIQRDKVIEYVKNQYKNVAQLSAYSKYKGRVCLQDIGRIFEVPLDKIIQLTSIMAKKYWFEEKDSVQRTFKEIPYAKVLLEEYPNLKYAEKLEGQLRQKTKNAAGIIISSEPLERFGSILKDDSISMDKDTAEKIGALKLDILGIKTLTAIHEILKLIKENSEYCKHSNTDKKEIVEINPCEIPTTDSVPFSLFKEMKLEGIYQFEGRTESSIIEKIPPENFEDLTAIVCIARPGSLQSGGADRYINIKKGINNVEYIHPSLEPILKESLGVIIYQEQVIRILREIAKFDWQEVTEIRKTVAKSKGIELFNRYKEKFVNNVTKDANFTKEQADKTWNELCTFGLYGFNKAHAVAYALVGYWCAWLKKYYPLEFYVGILRCGFDKEKQKRLIFEYQRSGGKVLNWDINESKKLATINDNKLRLGFLDIEGFGETSADEIVEKQPFKNSQDFFNRIDRRIINTKKMEILSKLKVIDIKEGQLELNI